MKWRYYHIHVADAPGYSAWFRSGKDLTGLSKIVKEALLLKNQIHEDDERFVDVAEQVDRFEYHRATIGSYAAERYEILHAKRKDLPLLVGTIRYAGQELAERLKGKSHVRVNPLGFVGTIRYARQELAERLKGSGRSKL